MKTWIGGPRGEKLNCSKIKEPSFLCLLTGLTPVINTSRWLFVHYIARDFFFILLYFYSTLAIPLSSLLGTMEKRFSCFKIKLHPFCYGSRGLSTLLFIFIFFYLFIYFISLLSYLLYVDFRPETIWPSRFDPFSYEKDALRYNFYPRPLLFIYTRPWKNLLSFYQRNVIDSQRFIRESKNGLFYESNNNNTIHFISFPCTTTIIVNVLCTRYRINIAVKYTTTTYCTWIVIWRYIL